MEYAIVVSGGKQYKATPGGTIQVDRLPLEVGASIKLDEVLLIKDGERIVVGTPTVKGSTVEATVEAQIRAPKIVVFKYKPKNRYRVKSGHRQQYTQLKIDKISAKSKKES